MTRAGALAVVTSLGLVGCAVVGPEAEPAPDLPASTAPTASPGDAAVDPANWPVPEGWRARGAPVVLDLDDAVARAPERVYSVEGADVDGVRRVAVVGSLDDTGRVLAQDVPHDAGTSDPAPARFVVLAPDGTAMPLPGPVPDGVARHVAYVDGEGGAYAWTETPSTEAATSDWRVLVTAPGTEQAWVVADDAAWLGPADTRPELPGGEVLPSRGEGWTAWVSTVPVGDGTAGDVRPAAVVAVDGEAPVVLDLSWVKRLSASRPVS